MFVQFSGIKYNFVLPSHHVAEELSSSCTTETLYPLNTNSSFSPPPALAASLLLSISMILSTLGTSYNWNHVVIMPVPALLLLTYFTSHNVLQVYSCHVSKFASFLRLTNTSVNVHTTFCYSSVNGHLGLLPSYLAIANNAAMNTGAPEDTVLIKGGLQPQVRCLDIYLSSSLSFICCLQLPAQYPQASPPDP